MRCFSKAQAVAQEIYKASWALLDADAIPQDYDACARWPQFAPQIHIRHNVNHDRI